MSSGVFKWIRGELINQDKYGKLYMALNAKNGEVIVVKQVEIPQTPGEMYTTRERRTVAVEALKAESETMKDLDHPRILDYLGFEITPTSLSLFMEYVPGATLGDTLRKVGKLDDLVVRSFTKQILEGLEYLHTHGVLHRDLNPEKILIDPSGQCKLSRFDMSEHKQGDDTPSTSDDLQNSLYYSAPELLQSAGVNAGYNAKCDIWRLGCVTIEMWTGKRAWAGRAKKPVAVMFKLGQGMTPPVSDTLVLPALAKDFRQKCFTEAAADRPTATALLQHQYLTLPPDWEFIAFQ